jgi:hypothetical protein
MSETGNTISTNQGQPVGCSLAVTATGILVKLRIPPVPKFAMAVLPFNANLSVVHRANEQLLVFQRPCWPV